LSDTSEIAAVGIVGLGVMGRNLALNLRERGFTVAGLDAAEPAAAARAQGIATVASLPELVTRTRRPRQLLVMLPAGPAVDSLLSDLAPWLDPGDVVLDGGNSHYKDTIRRAQTMERRGFGFIGLGVSGGAAGARHGPALMAGGSAAAWDCVAPALRAIAARFADEPCAGRIGPDGAGHFVKTVHNGIEYALMQLLAESYDLLRRGASLPPEAVAAAVEGWSRRSLASYLVEITADILRTPAEAVSYTHLTLPTKA
jgi:6-phosphogluconate dehydrogenase